MFDLKKALKNLEDRSVVELRDLYAEALRLEAAAKRDLYMIRQRIANLATDLNEKEEEALVESKKLVEDLIAYLKALEEKLHGQSTVKDYATGETFGKRNDA